MYNFFRLRNLKLHNTCVLSKEVITTPYRRACTLCSHITYTNSPVIGSSCTQLGKIPGKRHTSTFCNAVSITNEINRRKTLRKHVRKFAEIVEVVYGGHSETVARVKNLKPKEVSYLAKNPNVSLERFGNAQKEHLSKKVKSVGNKISKSDSTWASESADVSERTANVNLLVNQDYNSLPDTSGVNVGVTSVEEEMDELELHSINATVLNDPVIERDVLKEIKEDQERLERKAKLKSLAKDKKALNKKNSTTLSLSCVDKEQLAKIKLNDLQSLGKQQGLNSILLPYIETCVSCGFLNRGLASLQYYIKRSKNVKNSIYPTDVRIFDTLLQGFAAKGKYDKFNELWNMMKTLNLKLSHNSFAARLECIAVASLSQEGDLNNTPKINEIENVINEMIAEGISVNDLFEKCIFLGNQREVILEAIRKLYPEFHTEITAPDLCYSCSLLKELNEPESSQIKSPVGDIYTAEQLKEFSKEQFEHEIQGTIPIKSVEKRIDSSPLVPVYREKLKQLQKIWEKDILKALERDISSMNAAQNHTKTFRHSTLFPYLKVLSPEQYKDIIMQEITKLAEGSETFSPTTFQLYKSLGSKVRSRYIVKYKQNHGILDKTQRLFENYCEWYCDPHKGYQMSNARKEWQKLIYYNQEGPSVNIDEKDWPSIILSSLGKFLYNIILHDIKIDVNIMRLKSQDQQYLPAFYTIFRQQNNRSVEEIKPHPVLSKLFRATEPEELLFDVNLVPMVCPPLPWTSPLSGGYLIVKSDFLRLPLQAYQQKERLSEAPVPQLYPTYDSLNQLSCVPWKVNTQVLDTVIEVFNNGGSAKLDVPEPPSSCPMPESATASMTRYERYQTFKKRMAARRKKAEMYSLWCDALYRLSLANHFRDRNFWLPHNMDFRGRVYPCPPHLNHLGSDLARSLLIFAKGKPLGDTGLDWLKIHLVNLTGLKKKNSVVDRLVYANEILEDIVDSAQNPLSGRMWWSESETPWQTLACCMEIWKAIQHPGGPASYVSHFPVHQDGSCNGLQHYAALGRDKDGAASVNLSPALVPQDVYSCVAAMVEAERAKDAANNVKVAQELDGFIMRKVIKQTVMTTVYGVTRFGARLQIAKQLKDIDAFPKDYVWSGSNYLVGKTFDSLRQMFTSTREIQDWFTECARLISQVCGENVEYITPVGLPVVQPYTRRKISTIPGSNLGRINPERSYGSDMFERPNVMKQKNAFPPNFIHSLDSSHMMLTSLNCEQHGITFVSVHDCFWTHPCTVHIMNKICREQFVALHSQPILENLSLFLLDRFGYPESDSDDGKKQSQVTLAKRRLNSTIRNVPRKGAFQVENVLDSIYFFS